MGKGSKKKKKSLEMGKYDTKEIKLPDYDDMPPVFSFRHIQPKWCVSNGEEREIRDFIRQSKMLSLLTWKDIRTQDRHGLGCEKIERNEIKDTIPPIITDDKAILVFRYSELKPMVGFRTENIFHLVWFDRDFSLYDHG